jgi:hypothetical protein
LETGKPQHSVTRVACIGSLERGNLPRRRFLHQHALEHRPADRPDCGIDLVTFTIV